jgi:Sec-independent protein translocase protein TatA
MTEKGASRIILVVVVVVVVCGKPTGRPPLAKDETRRRQL